MVILKKNLVKTKYALILNPDVICSTNFFQEIGKYLSEKNDFSVIGCQYEDNSVYEPAGYFENPNIISKDVPFEFKILEVILIYLCEKSDNMTFIIPFI